MVHFRTAMKNRMMITKKWGGILYCLPRTLKAGGHVPLCPPRLRRPWTHLEKVWLRTRSLQDLQPLRTATYAYITRPQSMLKDLSLLPPQILASSGTPSTSLYIVNLHSLHSQPFPWIHASFCSWPHHQGLMAEQKITVLCLLDLAAAFDTIDYSILIHRLSSWFGLTGTVLSWLNSYISSRYFVVNIKEYISDPLPLHWGVPQGSVLGPLLFVFYTTPLSSLILIYLWNIISMPMTLNSISFSALDFTLNISHLKKLPSTMSQLGCQQTSCLSMNLKLNSCSLVFLNSFPNFLILLFYAH